MDDDWGYPYFRKLIYIYIYMCIWYSWFRRCTVDKLIEQMRLSVGLKVYILSMYIYFKWFRTSYWAEHKANLLQIYRGHLLVVPSFTRTMEEITIFPNSSGFSPWKWSGWSPINIIIRYYQTNTCCYPFLGYFKVFWVQHHTMNLRN